MTTDLSDMVCDREQVMSVGVVAIGRNEGERLVRCLRSLRQQLPTDVPIVYVDSDSTDDSVLQAKRLGVDVVQLDMSRPFTGARARNAGCDRLLSITPSTQCVQFIDGDCEILPGWIESGTRFLSENSKVGVVFGRLRERFPNATVYNQLADLEWNVPVGEASACGGISIMRTAAFKSVGGFDPALICGEEPELCIRLQRQGWKIRCIAVDMALHDMDMTRFGQWWKRSVRGGWAVAQGSDMYGHAPERYKLKAHLSGWAWGAILPLLALLMVVHSHGASLLLLLLLYGIQTARIYLVRQQRGDTPQQATLYAVFCVLSKVPQAIGQGKYWLNRLQNKPAQLIEYKANCKAN